MSVIAVAVAVAIAAGLAAPSLLRRAAVHRLRQIRDSCCERCGAPIDSGARFLIEGRMVCGACAGRTYRRVRGVLWGVVGISALGTLAACVAVWARWQRGEPHGLWLDGMLILGFPAVAGFSIVAARRLGPRRARG
ncbi:MAG: hypothetical protein IPI38_08060 [Gemmatimonadetes bacterium]|nr:hypothetical protein [Gemmatimonadota bacterium]MBK6782131.1 hypothetical protein [Gemmatimonadota bacterium]MBK7715363.1 hypothetical protein [Gemmatimonadota bacterium]MBK7923357.1 hypothetical protein [Gemmatimonadota bacterium]MBK9066817.1 hypothetical protein [Gemmatimonadota bacterium]